MNNSAPVTATGAAVVSMAIVVMVFLLWAWVSRSEAPR
jgi:hypothetical protein